MREYILMVETRYSKVIYNICLTYIYKTNPDYKLINVKFKF